jgi:phage tail sheath protein FI
MGFQLSPGVSVSENDFSTVIPAVASSPAAFVGNFAWGPVEQRVVVPSANDLYQMFGAPDLNTAVSFYTVFNFLQYGNNVTTVRGISGALNSIAGITGSLVGSAIKNDEHYDSLITSESFATNTSAYFAARYPGVQGNSLRIEVCDGITAFNSWSLSGNFGSPPGTSTYVQSLNGSTSANDEVHVVVIDEDGVFSGATGTILEIYEGLSKASDARTSDGSTNYFRNVLNQNSKYIWSLNNIQGVTPKLSTNGGSYGIISATGSAPSVGATAGLFVGQFAGGTAGGVPSNDALAALYTTYFGDADTVDVSLILGGGLTGSAAATVAQVAAARMDCVAFFSAPNFNPVATDSVKYQNCLDIRNAIGSNSYAFIDSSWKYQYDSYNNVYRWVPLNGDIAGLAARTDTTNDPWWSFAGHNRGQIRNVVKLGWNPNLTYRDLIYPKGINPVVTFPGDGTLLYGDKTAQTKPSAFDRINVRRLFIILEKSIAIASKYQLFEFNDAFTRANFVAMVEPFLRDVQARRGIYAFKVICDESNNTPQVIDTNRFVADIYIQPARSINFIKLNMNATRTGVNFEELAALNRPGA